MKWQIDYFHWWLLRVIKRTFNYFNSLEFKAAKKKISLLQVIRPFLETSVYLSPRKQPFQTSPGAGHHDGVTAPRPWDTRVCPQGQKTPGRVNRLRAERWRLRNSHRRWNPPSGCRNPISGWGRLTTSNSFYSFSYRCSQGKTHLDSHASDWGDPKADDHVCHWTCEWNKKEKQVRYTPERGWRLGWGSMYTKAKLVNMRNGEMYGQLENDHVLTLNEVSGTNGLTVFLYCWIMNWESQGTQS